MKYFYVFFALAFLFSSLVNAGNDLTDNECDEIWTKYKSLVMKLKGKEDPNAHIAGLEVISENASCYREHIRKLDITYTMEEVRKNFDKYGVLLLRPFNGKKLLLGCGNKPIFPDFETKPHHEHEQYDTVNPQLSMNPTLIAAFGLNDLRGLLPDTYEELAFEAFSPMKTRVFFGAFNHHCANVKDIFDIDTPYNKDEPITIDRLESIDEIFEDFWPEYALLTTSDDESSLGIYEACSPYHSDDDKGFSESYDEWSEFSDDDKEFLAIPWGTDYSEFYPEHVSNSVDDSLTKLPLVQEG